METIRKRLGNSVLRKGSKILLSESNMPIIEGFFQTADPQNKQNIRNEQSIHRASELWRQTPSAQLVIVANHQSHADAIPVTQIASKIRRETGRDFLLVTAATLLKGQGSSIAEFSKAIQPWCNTNGVEFVEVVTKNDIERGADPSKAAAGPLKLARARGKKGIIILPEGTVKAGRKKPRSHGRRFGMQEAADNFGDLMALLAGKKNVPVIIVPVGINKSYDVFGPSTKLPTRRVLADFVKAKLFTSPVRLAADVAVGEPFLMSDLEISQEYSLDLSRAIMQKVADLLPVEARGVYASA